MFNDSVMTEFYHRDVCGWSDRIDLMVDEALWTPKLSGRKQQRPKIASP